MSGKHKNHNIIGRRPEFLMLKNVSDKTQLFYYLGRRPLFLTFKNGRDKLSCTFLKGERVRKLPDLPGAKILAAIQRQNSIMR
jgi:hypothetical protein